MWDDSLERRHYERMDNNAPKASTNRKFDPWQMENMKFEKGENFYMRVMRPVDGSVYRRKHHWVPGAGAPRECTEDHPDFFDPAINKGRCSYCAIFSDKKDRGRQKVVDVLEVIDFRFFHIVPDDVRGGDKETIQRCAHDEPDGDIRENRCHLCHSEDERIRVRHFGGHKVLEMPGYQYEQLWAAHSKLSEECISIVGQDERGDPVVCKNKKGRASKNFILTFICRHCEDEIIDESVLQQMAPLAKRKMKSAKQSCKSCGKVDYPYTIYACDSGKGRTPTPSEIAQGTPPAEGEHWVVRGSMFDKPLEVTIAGQDKSVPGQRDPIVLKNLNISTGSSWSSLAADLSMFGFDDAQIEKICEPWDLAHRYRPSYKLKPEDFSSKEEWVEAVLREQAEVANRPYPFQDGSGGARSFKSSGQRRSFRS